MDEASSSLQVWYNRCSAKAVMIGHWELDEGNDLENT